jgi:hypothetical protein
MGKHSWIMYLFVIILLGVLLKNAAGSVGLILAGGSAATGFVSALQGPATTSKGSFKFGSTSFTLGK